MNTLQKNFLQALTETFKAYNEFGARSNKKLIPIHSWISKTINEHLNGEFVVNSLGTGGERTLAGKYYPKNLDITVLKEEKILSTVSFKFVTSNYKQNGNNYFENLLGETANIRRVNVGFAHLLVLRARTPYYDKNSGNLRGAQTKIEIINEHDISKYIKLFIDQDFPHKPDVLGIVIIDVDENENCLFADLNKLGLSVETQKILLEELSLDKFMDRFTALCRLKS
ncbi:MAG: hypothetical protein Q7R95_06570 [bacterium]|nr:hypothetical protein [bacterium]